MTDSSEKCGGCGKRAATHPIVAVMKLEDAKAIKAKFDGTNSRGFVGVPCCAECWREPRHRKNRLKAHFFHRGGESIAGVQSAGSSSIGG